MIWQLFQTERADAQSPNGHRAGDSEVHHVGRSGHPCPRVRRQRCLGVPVDELARPNHDAAAGRRTWPDHVSHRVREPTTRTCVWPPRRSTFRTTAISLELVQPVTVGERSLARFGRMLMLVIPLALVLASLGGYWLSGRALAPVTQITADARRINATNLSARLAVPPAHDELRELSETLNAMLGRIDQSISQLRQFTADASHELRAPLALIHTAAEFSLLRERPREELVEALEKILRESRHTASLVDSLLLLARADSGEEGQQPRMSINLSALCQDAADRAVELASAKGISVSNDLGPTSIVVDGDETALRRLLLILVDNAIKYTPAGGSVSIQLAPEENAALIRITDTGIGIAPADLPYVFDRFWRADKVRPRATGGTGLGLAIARWIVNRHGGVIVVSSEVGRGSAFTVTLPLGSRATLLPEGARS